MALFSSRITDTDILHVISGILSDRMVVFVDEKGDVIFRSSSLLYCKKCPIYHLGKNIYNNIQCPVLELFKIYPKSELKHLNKRVEKTVIEFNDGNKNLFHTSLEPIRLQSGKKKVYLFSVLDKTNLIQAEDDLRRQKELLDTIVRSSPHIVFVKDTSGKFLTCNANFEELLGASEDEAKGRNDYDFFEPEFADALRKHDNLALELGQKRINEEWLRYPDAHEKLFETTRTPLYGKDGSVLGILVVSKEITKEKEIQEKLMLTQYSVDNAIMPTFWVDVENGAIIYANNAACKSLGYTKEELTNLTVMDVDINLAESQFQERAREAKAAKKSQFKTTHKRKDGTLFPVEVITTILGYGGKTYGIGYVIDISERLEKERRLAKKGAMLRESQRIANVGSWELDLRTNNLFWTDQVYRILGIKRDVKPDFDLFVQTIHPQDRENVVNAYNASLEDLNKPYDIVHRVIVGGKVRYVHEQCETTRDVDGTPVYSIGTIRDMTDEHELVEQVRKLSLYDNLTKLPNRDLIKQELGNILKRDKKSSGLVAVCFIDLDEFKYINDIYSHEMGDKILKELARRLKEVANGTYVIGRFGADEFVVIIDGVDTPDEVMEKLNEFLSVIHAPFVVGGEERIIGASTGISLCPDDSDKVDDLIRFADIAMHQAKSFGRNKYAFYAQELTEKMSNRMRMLNQLQESITNSDFELYYQPQVSLENMEVVGFEALLRWNHPAHGMICPNDFIPLAEESGLIVPIGKWVLQSACLQAKTWKEEGVFDGRIAVNISGVQLESEHFVDTVKEALHVSGLEGRYLELEITETTMMNNQNQWLREFDALDFTGVTLAMDDFGTGYSSLASLRKMRLDVLKIDQSFVFDLPESTEACTMTKAIVGLAENLKMQSLAEGVENAEQLTFLKALSCKYAQGYYISRPMRASNVAEFLEYWKNTHKL